MINLKNTEKLIGKKIPIVEDQPYHTNNLVVEKRDSNNKPMSMNRPPRTSAKPKSGEKQDIGFKKVRNKNFNRNQ